MGRIKILEARVNRLEFSDVVGTIERFIEENNPHMVITANSLMVNYMEKDCELKEAFENAHLVVPDSVGIVWASRFLGYGRIERIPGIDLMWKLCEIAAKKGYRIYLLGSREAVVKGAAERLLDRFPSVTIAGTHHGYFSPGEEKNLIANIKRSSPHILFVGLSIPYQEKWISRHMSELNVPVCIGVGGSFDVISGRLKRAPVWMRRAGMEWFYRFLLEPYRLVRIMNLPVFVYKVVRQKMKSKTGGMPDNGT